MCGAAAQYVPVCAPRAYIASLGRAGTYTVAASVWLPIAAALAYFVSCIACARVRVFSSCIRRHAVISLVPVRRLASPRAAVRADSQLWACRPESAARAGNIRGRRRPTEAATMSRAEALRESPAGLSALLPKPATPRVVLPDTLYLLPTWLGVISRVRRLHEREGPRISARATLHAFSATSYRTSCS